MLQSITINVQNSGPHLFTSGFKKRTRPDKSSIALAHNLQRNEVPGYLNYLLSYTYQEFHTSVFHIPVCFIPVGPNKVRTILYTVIGHL